MTKHGTDFVGRGLAEATGKRDGAGAVNLRGSCLAEDAGCIVTVDTATGEDGKGRRTGRGGVEGGRNGGGRAGGGGGGGGGAGGGGAEGGDLLHEATEDGDADLGGGGTAGGEDAAHAEGMELTEGAEGVTDAVKGAVEGEGEAGGGTDEASRSILINRTFRGEGTADDGGGSGIDGRTDVRLHHLQLRLGINEVAFTRTDQDMDEEVGEPTAQLTDETDRGRQAVQRQRSTELDATCAALDSGLGAAEAPATDFENRMW